MSSISNNSTARCDKRGEKGVRKVRTSLLAKLGTSFFAALILANGPCIGQNSNPVALQIESIDSRFDRDVELASGDDRKIADLEYFRHQRLVELAKSLDVDEISSNSSMATSYVALLERVREYKELARFLDNFETRQVPGDDLQLVHIRALVNSGQVDLAAQRLALAESRNPGLYGRMKSYHFGIAKLYGKTGKIAQSRHHLVKYLDAQIDWLESDPAIGKSFSMSLSCLHDLAPDYQSFRDVANPRFEAVMAIETGLLANASTTELPDAQQYAILAAVQHAKAAFIGFREPPQGEALGRYLESVTKQGNHLPANHRVQDLEYCQRTLLNLSHLWADDSVVPDAIEYCIVEEPDPEIKSWLNRLLEMTKQLKSVSRTIDNLNMELPPASEKGTASLVFVCNLRSTDYLELQKLSTILKGQSMFQKVALNAVVAVDADNNESLQQGYRALQSRFPNCHLELYPKSHHLFKEIRPELLPVIIAYKEKKVIASTWGTSSEKSAWLLRRLRECRDVDAN